MRPVRVGKAPVRGVMIVGVTAVAVAAGAYVLMPRGGDTLVAGSDAVADGRSPTPDHGGQGPAGSAAASTSIGAGRVPAAGSVSGGDGGKAGSTTSPSGPGGPRSTTTSTKSTEVVYDLVGGPTLSNRYPTIGRLSFGGAEDTYRCSVQENNASVPVRVEAIAMTEGADIFAAWSVLPSEYGLCRQHALDPYAVPTRQDVGPEYPPCAPGVVLQPTEESVPSRKGCVYGHRLRTDNLPAGRSALYHGTLTFTLSTRCTAATSDPCNRLPKAPTPAQPVTVRWPAAREVTACVVLGPDGCNSS
jgi:hypothetical protein